MSDTLRLRVVLVVCALVLGSAAIKGTLALSFGQTTHAGSTYSTAAVYDPSAITSAPVDNTQTVAWTDAVNNHGNGNGYAVFAYHEGPSSTACNTTQANYTFVAGTSNASPSYTDSTTAYAGVGVAGTPYRGGYTCYMIRTWDVPGVNPSSWTSGTVPTWTSQIAPSPANQYVTPNGVAVGFFPSSVTMTNANGTLAAGDTVVLTYDQATNAPNLSGLLVCATKGANATFYLGQNVTTNACDTAGGSSIGTLTGGSYAAAQDGAWAAAYAWSNGNKTLTITIGAETFGTKIPSGMAGTWAFTASQSPEAGQVIVKSADATLFPCNANSAASEGIPATSQTNVCRPTTTTTF